MNNANNSLKVKIKARGKAWIATTYDAHGWPFEREVNVQDNATPDEAMRACCEQFRDCGRPVEFI